MSLTVEPKKLNKQQRWYAKHREQELKKRNLARKKKREEIKMLQRFYETFKDEHPEFE